MSDDCNVMVPLYGVVDADANGNYARRFADCVFEEKREAERWAEGAAIGRRFTVVRVGLRKDQLERCGGRIVVKDWSRAMTKDLRFEGWDADCWVRQFAEAEANSATGEKGGRCSDGGYTAEELLSKCDWWKFIGVEVYDRPKLMMGCPWFLDRPECSHIKPSVEDWALIIRGHVEFADRCRCWDEFSEDQRNEMLEYHPELSSKLKKG